MVLPTAAAVRQVCIRRCTLRMLSAVCHVRASQKKQKHYARKKLPLQILRTCTGTGGVETPTPGICLIHAQDQASGNVTPTIELCPPHLTVRIKVRARRGVPEK